MRAERTGQGVRARARWPERHSSKGIERPMVPQNRVCCYIPAPTSFFPYVTTVKIFAHLFAPTLSRIPDPGPPFPPPSPHIARAQQQTIDYDAHIDSRLDYRVQEIVHGVLGVRSYAHHGRARRGRGVVVQGSA